MFTCLRFIFKCCCLIENFHNSELKGYEVIKILYLSDEIKNFIGIYQQKK